MLQIYNPVNVTISKDSKHITIGQGENAIEIRPQDVNSVVDMLMVAAGQCNRNLEIAALPTETEIYQMSSYLFGGNRNALSDADPFSVIDGVNGDGK